MKRKIFLLSTLLAFACASIYSYDLTRKEKEKTYKDMELFADVLAIVQEQYVESVDSKELIYGSLRGMMEALDPYSDFMDPEKHQELIEETAGKFGGIGVEISMREGVLTVVTPLEGTPAWEADLQPNDKIVKINGELTKGVSLEAAVGLLRGDPGTDVKVSILREKENKIFSVTIKRAIISLQDIKRYVILEDSVAYVRIAQFSDVTVKDLAKALKELKKQGMEGLIIDLRSNPGGLLDSAVDVASLFIDPGKKVVEIIDRDNKKDEFFSRRIEEKTNKIPMVILVNDGSASGSEIVAGCLQDYKRALILGVKTFGKGSVQTVIPLTDGAALKLTTAKYYTPVGRMIHEKGIEPDIVVENRKIKTEEPNGEDELFEKYDDLDKKENGNLAENTEEETDDKDDDDFYKKDYQILRALDLVRGLIILGDK